MKLVPTWTIQATAGTPGVNEDTFQYAIIVREKATNAEEAIAYVGAADWRYHGLEPVSVFARESFAAPENVGDEGSGEPGSVGIPDFDTEPA